MVFEAVIQLLQDFGFFRIVLPFLLIFAIFYAVLLKTKILGEADESRTRTIASIVALAAAFLVIAYTPVVDALTTLIPQASFLLVVVMLFLMLLAFIVPNWETDIAGNKWWWIGSALVLFVIFLAIVGTSVGEQIPILYGFSQFMVGAIPFDLTQDMTNLLIGLAIIIGIPLIVIGIIVFGSKKEE